MRKRITRLAATFVLAGAIAATASSAAGAQTVPIAKFFVAPEAAPRAWVQANTNLPASGYVPTPVPDEADAPGPEYQAGAHPNLNIFIRYCNFDDGVDGRFGCGPDVFPSPKHFRLSLPPGLLGNPVNVPVCPQAMFMLSACPANTAVGETANSARYGNDSQRGGLSVYTKLFNVDALGGAPALLGTSRIAADPPGPLPVRVSLRPDDYGIDSTVEPVVPLAGGATHAEVFEQRITLFGTVNGKPFLTNPTSCQPATTRLWVTSWDQTADSTNLDESQLDPGVATSTYTPVGCGNLPFSPGMDIDRDSDQAGAPTGYDVRIHFPDSELDPVHQAHMREAKVTLPKGVSLAPSAARTLAGCSAAGFGLGNDQPIDCPIASRIGRVRVTSPVLDVDPSTPARDPLEGYAYFGRPDQPGQPTAAHPWKLYIAIEGSGVRLKLAGDVTLGDDGRIATRFSNLPQAPFTDFDLQLNGGDRAVLTNPRDCTSHAADVQFTGWNGATVASPTASVTPSLQASGCSDPEPFAPALDAALDDSGAGKNVSAQFDVDRADGDALLRKLTLALPAGLVGSLNAAPLCDPTAARSGNCGDHSKIGRLTTTVGYGASQLDVDGSLYIAGPTDAGDVATVVAAIPAKVGPIDLGTVVVLNHVKLRQSDGGLTTVSEPIPTAYGGVPLTVKHVALVIDRKNFLRNATGCETRSLDANFESDLGDSAEDAVGLTATGCDQLPFSPRLRLVVPGGAENTHKGRVGISNHTPLKAIVSQNPGEAAIKRAVVVLPSPLRPDTGVLNRPGVLCTTAEATIGVCRPQSRVGTASVDTPLLPQPLTGPVYIVQDPGNVLPKLLVQLRGMAAIDLVAGNRIDGVRTVNTFDSLPDVPQGHFELSINGGPGGILYNFNELCDSESTADAIFTAHSGANSSSRPKLEVEGCGVRAAQFKVRSQTARVSRAGVAKLRVECPIAKGSCPGQLTLQAGSAGKASARRLASSRRFAIAAGKVTKVPVQLTRRALKQLRKRGRLTAKTGSGASAATVKLKRTKPRHASR